MTPPLASPKPEPTTTESTATESAEPTENGVCPDCGSPAINVQGLLDCPDCEF